MYIIYCHKVAVHSTNLLFPRFCFPILKIHLLEVRTHSDFKYLNSSNIISFHYFFLFIWHFFYFIATLGIFPWLWLFYYAFYHFIIVEFNLIILSISMPYNTLITSDYKNQIFLYSHEINLFIEQLTIYLQY